jgi:hypothetical protein
MSIDTTFELPATNTIQQNAKLWAEHYNNIIQAGHGLFFDFKATPELEKPALDCLVNTYGWKLEKPFFIRKPIK